MSVHGAFTFDFVGISDHGRLPDIPGEWALSGLWATRVEATPSIEGRESAWLLRDKNVNEI